MEVHNTRAHLVGVIVIYPLNFTLGQLKNHFNTMIDIQVTNIVLVGDGCIVIEKK